MSEKSVLLNSGHAMPLLGLGCSRIADDELAKVVETALEAGYCHIDTATSYQNEAGVGAGVRNWLAKSENKREDVFVVTKLPGTGMYKESVEKFLKRSLKLLGLPYVDLYLVHMPFGMKPSKDENDFFPRDDQNRLMMDNGTDLIAIWKEMERMVELGLTKSIGVSNFNVKQMRKICAVAKIPPATNQVEMHVHFQQQKMQDFCKEHNIYLTAYSPLGSPGKVEFSGSDGKNPKRVLEDPVVVLVADHHKVTPAQVLIRFLVQQQVITIPKSANPARIKTNADIWNFTLSELDMAALKTRDQGEDERIFNFPVLFSVQDHPEYPF